MNSIDEVGIVYGSGNKIMAWHNEIKDNLPVVLNKRKDYITSFFFDGKDLFDAGYKGVVRNSVTDEIVNNSFFNLDSPIYSLGFIEGDFFALREIGGLPFLHNLNNRRVFPIDKKS